MASHISAPVRVVALAIAISTLSFAAGMAGDLAAPPPAAGARIVVAIPPNALRLPQTAHLLATPAAQALTTRSARAARALPRAQRIALRAEATPSPMRASPKSERAWSRPPDPKPVFAELVKQEFVKV